MKRRQSEKHMRHDIVETPAIAYQNVIDGAAETAQPSNEGKSYSSPEAYEHLRDRQATGTAALSVILSYMVAYFCDRADVEDLDALSFSLHHLFCRVDYLYRLTLPHLLESFPLHLAEQSPKDELLQRQSIWTKLRSIKYALGRMEPLCNLLSDATRCMLDALDVTREDHVEVDSSEESSSDQDQKSNWHHALNHKRWEQALTTLTDRLHSWQKYSDQPLLFADYFAQLLPPMTSLSQLDQAFSVILDSTGAIFGDILPDFQAISAGDDDAVAMLLFDLMQQADQLLVQFDVIMEPLDALIEHFALMQHR